MLAGAGVRASAWDLFRRIGHVELQPRRAARMVFLRWVAAQPWGGRGARPSPIGGVDGTLARRFKGHAAGGQALRQDRHAQRHQRPVGLYDGKSGRTLTFSAYANDVPEGVVATKAMDAALELIAAENWGGGAAGCSRLPPFVEI